MKTRNLHFLSGMLLFTIMFYLLSNVSLAQSEPVKTPAPDSTVTKKDKDEGKKDKKRKDEFIVYIGANFDKLSVSSNAYEATMKAGYHIGFNYKRGKFFYWQVGLRYNNPVYGLKSIVVPPDTVAVESNFGIRDLDIPITGGINFLSATNRLLALRIFISAVPSFNVGVGDNDLGITKDNINSFIIYGQAGLGVNVAFVVIEAGYNFGFSDILQEAQSKPGQILVNLGFRF
jgi:hypothetical protein